MFAKRHTEKVKNIRFVKILLDNITKSDVLVHGAWTGFLAALQKRQAGRCICEYHRKSVIQTFNYHREHKTNNIRNY